MKQAMSDFLKGAWIGGTLTVPGVSGGSMAMILGIYERLIRSVNGLLERGSNKKESIRFLLIFCSGAIAGIFALSWIVVRLLELFPVPILFFFAGAVAGGVPVLFREVRSTVFRYYHVLFLLGGMALVVLLSKLPVGLFEITPYGGIKSALLQLLGGLIAAAALVLPGISVSHMLYVLGIYEGLMQAVSGLQIGLLLPFAAGGVLGTFLMAKAVDRLLRSYKTSTYMVILGFVLGSVAELLSGIRVQNITFACAPLFFLGFFAIFLLFKKSKAGA